MFSARLAISILALAVSATVVTPAPAESVRPSGAVKLSKKRVKRVGSVTCGKLGTRWQPGTRLAGGYFVTHAQQGKNFTRLARRASGRKKRGLKRRAAAFRRKAAAQRRKCAKLGGAAPQAPAAPAPAPPAAPTPAGGPVVQPPAHVATPLRFNLTGAVGLALRDASSAARAQRSGSGSNLAVVTAAGGTRDAVTSGSAAVGRFLIAPSDKVYVLFELPVNLADTSTGSASGCLLAEVAPATGVPTCIDAELSRVTWEGTRTGANPAVQFDQTGAAYYTGATASGKTVLRRYRDGARTDLITDDVSLDDFLVRPDGTVFITGQTTSTSATWVRKLTPAGGLQSVRATSARFLRAFPDGNVYMGLWATGNFGVRRFLTGTNQVEPKFWIADDINAETPERYFDASDFCAPDVMAQREGFCGWYGSLISDSVQTTDGAVHVLAGEGGNETLFQYYPTVAATPTAVRKIAVMDGLGGTKIALAGLDDADRHVTTLLDTAGTETELIGPDDEIEIYHLDHVAGGGAVLFDGLRFADNKYVLGRVDLASGEVTVSTTSATRWEDLQAFE